MTDNQENKLTMYRVLVAYLWKHIEIWQILPAFSEIANKIKSNIVEIGNLNQIQSQNNSGIVIHKRNIETNLIDAVLKVAKALIAYATINKNSELLAQVKVTKTTFERLRDELIASKALDIHSIAVTLTEELSSLLINPDDIAAIPTLATSYNEILPTHRDAEILRKNATADMKAKFKEQDAHIADLDAIVPIFETDHRSFVQGYWNARIIIDLGRRKSDKTIIAGHVTDASNELPITNAYVWIRETGTSYNTNDEGYFSINVKEAGNYTIEVQKQTYKTYIHDTIHLNTGNRLSLDIDLEPET